jgi:hypothetical protein
MRMNNEQWLLFTTNLQLFEEQAKYVGALEMTDGAFGKPRSEAAKQMRAAKRDMHKTGIALKKMVREIGR